MERVRHLEQGEQKRHHELPLAIVPDQFADDVAFLVRAFALFRSLGAAPVTGIAPALAARFTAGLVVAAAAVVVVDAFERIGVAERVRCGGCR